MAVLFGALIIDNDCFKTLLLNLGNRKKEKYAPYFLKGSTPGLRQFLPTESSLRMMNNAFYFTLKAFFLNISNFFSDYEQYFS